MNTLADLVRREAGDGIAGSRAGSGGRRLWLGALAVAGAWACWSSGVGRRDLVNQDGWSLMARFWGAAVHPELSLDFLRATGRGAAVTLSFAVLATALAVAAGLVGGVLSSETWWRREARPGTGSQDSRRLRAGWALTRATSAVPRGVHEAVWGLLLLNILGRDPLVGILAIAIPFGAITAKVYAELIDEAADGHYYALLAAGSGRLSALAYGVLPRVLPDLVSYAFYRLECSIRSAVILGMIGAGGLGFQLNLSFQSLAYGEMWTLIYALVALSAVADRWGAQLRRRSTASETRLSLGIAAVAIVASALHLRPDLGRLLSSQSRSLLGNIVGDAWPPALPSGGWPALLRGGLDTLQMSMLAILLGGALALGTAVLAARREGPLLRRAASSSVRLVLLVTRSIPPPVWALLVLFVAFPGPVPGALALGVYNFGVLGRLMAEVVENLDPGPERALRTAGSGSVGTFLYAVLPLSASRFAAYGLYRWEVAVRETVVVGLVGAGGLGSLLEQQRVSFDYAGMLTTVVVLIGLALAVDMVSSSARRVLR